MALKKPTITHCIDGKDHSWLIVSEETDDGGSQWEHRWCSKCGVLTQITYNESGEPIAVMNGDNTHYLMVPKVLGMVTK